MKKNLKRKNQKGFTLVELLIVIIILGILASIVVPRMVAQTTQANTAEAVNMLGAIRRSALALQDSTAAAATADFSMINGVAAGAWANLGLGNLPANARFDYAYVAANGTNIVATRRAGGADGGRTINMDILTGVLTCGAGYTAVNDPQGNAISCR